MVLDYVRLKDIKSALSGYLLDSQKVLRRTSVPDEEAVHDIRVLMKKARATLKLLKSQVKDELYARENLAYRETGRLLCSWRDSSVLRKALKILKKENPGLFSRLTDNEQITNLLSGIDASEVPSELHTRSRQVDTMLMKAAFRIRFESLANLNPQLLLKELEQTYTVVGENYLKCRNNTKPEWLHEFRKRSKDFLYQLYFFRPLNPGVIKGLEKKLDMLTQNLGKFNDLTQIIRIVEYNYDSPGNSPAMSELIVVIKNKQDQYLSKVWPVAYEIFCPGQKLLNLLGFKLLVI